MTNGRVPNKPISEQATRRWLGYRMLCAYHCRNILDRQATGDDPAFGERIVKNANGVAHTDTHAGSDELDGNDRKSAYRH
jgi:hypothetical protein